MAYIQFLGAAGTVTGSKHLINTSPDDSGNNGLQTLIDCGMFQGPKEWRDRNWQDSPVPAREIDAVVLTHAHLDHCGWIPRLVKQGFRGPIYATSSTIDLCGIILPDSGHLQEEDAAFYNKTKSSKHHPALPLYTFEEAQECLQYFRPLGFEESKQLSPEISFRFVRSAHILGSSMVELKLTTNGQSRQLLFTGDIGRVRDPDPGKVLRSGPTEGEIADVLVMESTYGNRQHPTNDPRPELAALIRKTVERGGSVIVPAFAVERTQKFLFILKQLMEAGQIPRIPIYCEQSKKINENRFPLIIISSSGMVTGGRIQHHLAQRLPDPKNTVIFIGFQAPGTRGATIKSGAPEVKIFGQIVPIRAQVAAFEQFSDHADPPELLQWLGTFPRKPAVTYLVHGEPAASTQLRDTMKKELGWDVEVVQWMQKVEIK